MCIRDRYPRTRAPLADSGVRNHQPSIRGAVMRTDWVAKRQNDTIRTQMHYARKGMITEEMLYIAKRESLAPELVRSEVARGRMIILSLIHHTNLEPMCIGVASKCKINSNIG